SSEQLLVQNSATMNFTGPTTLAAGPYQVKDSTLNFNSPSTIVIPTSLTVTNGNIGGSGTVQFDGLFTASNTGMPGPGKTVIGPTCTATFATGTAKTVERIIENHGMFFLSGGVIR